MNNDILKGKWKQLKGEAKQRWSELTDDDLDRIDGKKEELVGAIQEKYGKTKKEAEQELEEFREKLDS
ncbi:MAG: CsbD family protein [Gammaproteobacteria bacterium]|nr:CsbD family protein [Gammaproteobacteria bacterium]MBT8150066.1 CsbD family protein [Gammaproteobacteria bacterium]NND39903.1 CsbD family protein [Pseudomonadales bacterium]NNM12443.1 CsbD family protein [Pseudomonadales bacterium]